MRIAVLDDYQKAAHRFADWDALGAEVVFLHDHVSGTAELAGALDGVDVVVAMRERTPSPRSASRRCRRCGCW